MGVCVCFFFVRVIIFEYTTIKLGAFEGHSRTRTRRTNTCLRTIVAPPVAMTNCQIEYKAYIYISLIVVQTFRWAMKSLQLTHSILVGYELKLNGIVSWGFFILMGVRCLTLEYTNKDAKK